VGWARQFLILKQSTERRMLDYSAPGLYRQDIFPASDPVFLTGVPVFLGYAARGAVNEPSLLSLWSQFGAIYGDLLEDGYLGYAVRGFFENGGLLCYVVRLDDRLDRQVAHQRGLEAARPLDAVDLVCAPDVMRPARDGLLPDPPAIAAMQRAILDHCAGLGDRFAILDARPTADVGEVLQQRAALDSAYGALYHPWVVVPGWGALTADVPPCGHVAGIFARCDQRVGVHKAPANEVVEGVLDLRAEPDYDAQQQLFARGVNYMRAFAGRGIRLWGARTLSADPAWRYVNVRRLFLTVGRWLERFMLGLSFEQNDLRLWARILRELSAYFDELFRRSALVGGTPDQAYYVKCDSETNPPDVVRSGMVIAEVGLAPVAPGEFIVARIIHGASGVNVLTDSGPMQAG